MRKIFEHLLLSVLIGLTILLGLTFWLNIKFGFNLLSNQHWQELASLQASGQPINKDFYVSIGAALLLFIFCLNIIYRPHSKKPTKPVNEKKAISDLPMVVNQPISDSVEPEKPTMKKESGLRLDEQQNPPQKQSIPEPNRPPKLALPKNIAQIAAAQHSQQKHDDFVQTDKYDDELVNIFSTNSFLVKKKPTIYGFTPNLFAIGANEIVWIGGVDCEIEKLNNAIQKLENTFKETLQDITITVNSFIIDTVNKYKSNPKVHIFHNIDELKQYISKNPGEPIKDSDREDFDAYSDYIDTVLTLLYKI
ncbi:MAG: hypothetical protein J6S57_01230 [Alphaproteobacteria bacterium]|nr:hypothetical protein [Alphaproteobacteria bacterium]